MCRRLVPLVPLALLLAAAPAVPAERARHPALRADDAADACESCHAQATPAVVKEWEAGPHGLMLVKCFVCHGSTGKDFVRRAPPQRCSGCHPDEVATAAVVPAKKTSRARPADCFSCHSPHALAAPEGGRNPHTAK